MKAPRTEARVALTTRPAPIDPAAQLTQFLAALRAHL
jgi:hypothetical protein